MDPNSRKRDLINKLSREELIQRLEAEEFKRRTISFYRYVIIEDAETMRDDLYREWDEINALGRI